jgi:hypothetical protein
MTLAGGGAHTAGHQCELGRRPGICGVAVYDDRQGIHALAVLAENPGGCTRAIMPRRFLVRQSGEPSLDLRPWSVMRTRATSPRPLRCRLGLVEAIGHAAVRAGRRRCNRPGDEEDGPRYDQIISLAARYALPTCLSMN